MKHFRKVETGREPISDREIENMKPSFPSLLDRMKSTVTGHPRNGLKRWIIPVLSVAAVSVIVLGFYFLFPSHFKTNVEQTNSSLLEPVRKINPPEPSKLVYENFVIRNGQKAVFVTKKGTRVEVPAMAFVYPDGKPCHEEVIIKYREFHNPLEVFLSGVPMKYDSAGVSYTFETAGMFDIRAFSSSVQLKLADGKGVHLEMVSNEPGLYNVYYFDTVSNRWNYITREEQKDVVKKELRDQSVNSVSRSVGRDTGEILERPEMYGNIDRNPAGIFKKRDKKYYAFKIEFDPAVFPELAGIRDLLFEVRDKSVEKQYLRGSWDSISLVRNPDSGYRISLYRFGKNYSFHAQPVLNAASYDEQVKKYMAEKEIRERKNEAGYSYTRVLMNDENYQDSKIQQWAYTRSMTIYNLGYWNCDRPVPQPVQAVARECVFRDSNNNLLNPMYVYVVQKRKNILWTYLASGKIKYSKKLENLVWIVLPDGKYGLVTDGLLRKNSRVIVPEIVANSQALERIGSFM